MKNVAFRLLGLSFLTMLFGQPLPAQKTTKPAAATNICERICVIGASVSAGFLPEEPLGGKRTPEYSLQHYLACALKVAPTTMTTTAETFLFMNVEPGSKNQIEKAVAAQPTLTVGVDFLFWHCYGRVKAEEDRLAMLEQGLTWLEKLPGQVVVGDIPDASAATGGMLNAQQVPKLATITTANQRLREWAKSHPKVLVLPIAEFMATAMADRALKIGEVAWEAGKTRKLLQSDKLHAARHGCAALALSVMHTLVEQKLLPADQVNWDVEAVFTKAVARATKPKPTSE